MRTRTRTKESLEARVRRAVRAALRGVGKPSTVVEVFFMNEEEMRELKRATTGVRARTVDVLSFEEPKGFPHPGRKMFLGEVYVNIERYGGVPNELLTLVLHSVAHLLGFRHTRARDTMEMKRAEKVLLRHARGAFG
jgi:ssRNA-specific RNase YbeY (16S rRNA maturation enzyme)